MKTLFLFLIALSPGLSLAQDYGHGLIPHSEASLRNVKRISVHRKSTSDSVDLSRLMPAPGDQGHQGSCVAWAVAYARAYYSGFSEGRRLTDKANIPSPAYIYRSIMASPNQCGSGGAVDEALNLLRFRGAGSWAAFPYGVNDCGPLSSTQVAEGTDFRIFDYEYIDKPRAQDSLSEYVDNIKVELEEGNPLIVEMRASDAFEALRPGAIYNHPTTCKRGDGCYHAVVFVGYDNRRQAFKVLNSWGTKWADGGYGWIAYETAKSEVFGAYVIRMDRGKPQIARFAALSSRNIVEGQSFTLTWQVWYADSLEMPGVGDLTRNADNDCTSLPCDDVRIRVTKMGNDGREGSVTLKPARSTTYTLRAENAKGIITATVDVTVTPRVDR
jgi:C1A family cysteine protease